MPQDKIGPSLNDALIEEHAGGNELMESYIKRHQSRIDEVFDLYEKDYDDEYSADSDEAEQQKRDLA